MNTNELKQQPIFNKGETVLIISGPFSSFKGKVESVNTSNSTITVSVIFMGNTQSVELDYKDVENV